jgi:ketosteroid isomerase-like protein
MTFDVRDMRRRGEQIIAWLNARDFAAIEASGFFGAAAQFRSAIAVSEGEVYSGVDGLRQWARNVDETWDDFHIEVLDVQPSGPNRAVAVFRVTARARASEVPLDIRVGQVWTWSDDGVWIANDSFTDPAEAFEAAGLPYPPSTRAT